MLKKYDVSIDTVVKICISKDSVEVVLETISHEDIRSYCYKREINIELNYFSQICDAVKEFTASEKTQLLLQLIKLLININVSLNRHFLSTRQYIKVLVFRSG